MPDGLLVTLPDEATILRPAELALAEAKATQISDPQMLSLVTADLKALGVQEDKLIEAREAITKPLMASHKAAMDLFRKPLAYIADAKTAYKGAIADWNERERQRVAEAQRLADEEARKIRQKAEEDAAKARAKAEAEARELAAKAEAARAAGDEGKAAQLETRANNTIEAGEAKVAVLSQVAATAVAPVVAGPVKAAGTRETTRYVGEFTDEAAFKAFVGANPLWHHFIKIDEGAVNRHLQASKGKFTAPGLVVRTKASIAA